jgi:serine/threonine protein phosphatase PrpC
LGIWAVADGVGGHQLGETASKAVVEAIGSIASGGPPENPVECVRLKILEANRRLVDIAKDQDPPAVIASTVAALVAEDYRCVCLWAGDSRVYGFRQGRLSRLTRDHSEVEDLVEEGRLSADEALHHPDANIIYRAIGKSEVLELDAVVYDVHPNDKFMLCTDGLTKEVEEQEIAGILSHGDCGQNCRDLLDLVLSRDCRDNVAIVVVDVKHPADPEPTVQVARLRSGGS